MAESEETEARPRDERKERIESRRRAARWSAIGIQIAVSVAVGALFGQWLDSKFGTEPVLLLVFMGLGVVAAFRDLYRMAKKEFES